MKVVKLDSVELSNAISDGDFCIEVGSRKYVLFEVEEVSHNGNYEVTDTEEELLLLEAMDGDNPNLSKQEVLELLSRRNQQ